MPHEDLLQGLLDEKYLDDLVRRVLRPQKGRVVFLCDMAAQMIRLAAKRGIKLSEARALQLLDRESRRQQEAFERRTFR